MSGGTVAKKNSLAMRHERYDSFTITEFQRFWNEGESGSARENCLRSNGRTCAATK
jgi:hypothetical protein